MCRELVFNGYCVDVVEEQKVIFSYDCEQLFFLWQSEVRGMDISKIKKMANGELGEELMEDLGEPESLFVGISNNELYVAITGAADQAGALGIIDINSGEIIHKQEASFYCACVTTENQVFVLRLVYFYGHYPNYELTVLKKGNGDFVERGESIDISEGWWLSPYNERNMRINGDKLLISSGDETREIDIEKWLKK